VRPLAAKRGERVQKGGKKKKKKTNSLLRQRVIEERKKEKKPGFRKALEEEGKKERPSFFLHSALKERCSGGENGEKVQPQPIIL